MNWGAAVARVTAPLAVALAVFMSGCSDNSISVEDLETAAESLDVSDLTEGDVGEALVDIEKPDLKFGFIKLTDCAPLVIAKEKGYFSDEGLNVELEAQTSWKVLLDGVISKQLDGAHMLAGQPMGATVGITTEADIITAYSLDYNGNGITVSNEIWKQMQENDPALATEKPKHPISADSLKPIVEAYKQRG
ncbi:MAG: ABC transporter substrate-binding protein, partial [Planctomycetota bacterium]